MRNTVFTDPECIVKKQERIILRSQSAESAAPKRSEKPSESKCNTSAAILDIGLITTAAGKILYGIGYCAASGKKLTISATAAPWDAFVNVSW